jgi:hypothetical protein
VRSVLGRCLAVAALSGVSTAPCAAQSVDRVSFETTASIDVFGGPTVSHEPQIIFDIAGAVRLGAGWQVFVRPWFRLPRPNATVPDPEWDNEIYQAQLRYERHGRVSTRVEAGYLASPIGLGQMDSNPRRNPTIVTHLMYVTPMLPFERGTPRVPVNAVTYPLGAQVTLSSSRWDARSAVVRSAPNRAEIIGASPMPHAAPAIEFGGGYTPITGLRFGGSFAHGTYATSEELTAPATGSRQMTLAGVEGEYAFGFTKVSGEYLHNSMTTATSDAVAHTWFLQGIHTLAPRWAVSARHEGTSAPPVIFTTKRLQFLTFESTVAFRATTDITIRGSYFTRRFYTRTDWDHQAGIQVVWFHRWR